MATGKGDRKGKSRTKGDKETGYAEQLKKFRSASGRHVLILEASLSEDDKRHIFSDADDLRRCGNDLVRIMKKRYEQMTKTRKHKKLLGLYKHYKEKGNDEKLEGIKKQLKEMQGAYGITKGDCESLMKEIYKKRKGVNSQAAQRRADDIWEGVEKVLYGDGKGLGFRKRGDLPAIQGKQINRLITPEVRDGRLYLKYKGKSFTYKDYGKDRFLDGELNAMLGYLEAPEVNDRHAVEAYLASDDKILTDTFRPCYASLVCEKIRGKLRVFVHITLEGNAKPKVRKDGTPRHRYGDGRIGCDIGTQSYAYTSDKEAGIENLSERGPSCTKCERQEERLSRAMERSRRAMNPQNYNEDGTIKKGYKKWHNSKRYYKLRERYRDVCRKNALNRRYACNEEANRLRGLGDVFITERPNASALAKRAKKTERQEKAAVITKKDGTEVMVHKYKRKKRFGKSIRRRCPGYFQARIKQVFEGTGGRYVEVPSNFRASQFDHTCDEYIKKTLGTRLYRLTDGTLVQRDWYSSFLMYCADDGYTAIDRTRCLENFHEKLDMEHKVLDTIRKDHKMVMNSGIKPF